MEENDNRSLDRGRREKTTYSLHFNFQSLNVLSKCSYYTSKGKTVYRKIWLKIYIFTQSHTPPTHTHVTIYMSWCHKSMYTKSVPLNLYLKGLVSPASCFLFLGTTTPENPSLVLAFGCPLEKVHMSLLYSLAMTVALRPQPDTFL